MKTITNCQRGTLIGVLSLLSLLAAHPSTLGGSFLKIRDGYFWEPATAGYFVPHGVAYQTWNPEVGANQTFDQLEYDLVEFKKIHANSVRAEMVWNIVETSPGAFDWQKPDYLVAKAEELGLKLFVLIGFQYAPAWFPDEWRATNDQDHVSVVLNYEHPDARRAYTNYIGQVTSRYKNSTAIGGWILGNEYAYFDLWEPSRRFLGYDLISGTAFRSYLESIYDGDIATLNANWGTAYSDFDSVAMPRQYPADRHNPGYHDLIQWRKKSIGDFVAAGAVAAKAADPNHLLTYSMVGGLFGEYDEHYTCEDAKTIVGRCATAGAPLDFWSINNYAFASLEGEMHSGDFGIAKHKAQSGLPVMVSETGLSSTETIHPEAKGLQAQALPSQMWEALSSGAIGVHVFTWNDRDLYAGGGFSREQGFGIVNQNRTIKNPVYWNMVEMFRRMEEIKVSNLFGGSAHPPLDIQFFWSRAADMGWPRANHENLRIWSALKRLGYQPGIIDDEQLENGAYTNAPALLLSRCYQMDPRHLDLIATKAIAAGIHLHANADLPGQYDAYNRPNPNWATLMNSIFGLLVSGARPALDAWAVPTESNPSYGKVTFIGKNALGVFSAGYTDSVDSWKIWHGLRAGSGTTVVTHTGLGGSQAALPALQIKTLGLAKTAVNTFALGDTIAVGNRPATDPWDVRHDWLRAIYRDHFGIKPAIDLTGFGAAYVAPDYRICRNGSVLISLYNEHTNSASVTLSATLLLKGKTIENLTAGGILATDSAGEVNLNLAGNQYVLLYAYARGESRDESLVNPSPHKIWFESAPVAVWPNGTGYEVNIGYDIRGAQLNLVVGFEQIRPSNKTYAKSARFSVSGRGKQALQMPVPDADLNDPGYLSSRNGGEYIVRAWLETAGVRVSETSLPVRFLWGAHPLSPLPANVIPGRRYPVTVEWQELPSYQPGDPTPLSRADLWDSLQATAEHYKVVLELRANNQSVASAGFVTGTGTDNHQFSVVVPPNVAGAATWVARVQTAPNVSSHNVQENFEGRALGADYCTNCPPRTTSLLAPWVSNVYSQSNTAKWYNLGVQSELSYGGQSAFMVAWNPPDSGDFAGFFLDYDFNQEWSLPSDPNEWKNYTFAFDFKEANTNACVLEMQIKNKDDDQGGIHAINFTKLYTPSQDGWDTNKASLNEFIQPDYFATFDPAHVHSIVVSVQMLNKDAIYLGSFDNIQFLGPESADSTGADFAIYTSANDTLPGQADTDGDGIPNVFETGTGVYVSPTNTGTNPNQSDTDGDKQGDGQELRAGTNPNSASDFVAIQGIQRNTLGEVIISWPARKGHTYAIFYCEGNLMDGAQFVPLANMTNVTIEADGVLEAVDHSAATSKQRFYRIAVGLP